MPKKKKKRPQHFLVREDLDPVDYDPAIVAEVESLFKKKFAYLKDEGAEKWPLPPAAEWFTSEHWRDDELQALAMQLNEVKASLSHLDITKWHEHTQLTNRAGTIRPYLHRNRKPELCTQAWCKFYEVVSSYPLVPHEEVTFSSVHLCEAPGAFITSLNHYLKSTQYRGRWHWLASTLNPHYEGNDTAEMVIADRFICSTLDHWHWGWDDTGNIMHRQNVEALVEAVHMMHPIQLVTGDGSIDCANSPELQEVHTSHLHFCEVAAGMLLLSPGGSMVTKMFTLFEDCSISLLYLLNATFEQVHVFKPATSKSGNSEVYVVSMKFKGISEEYRRLLLSFVNPSASKFCLFPKSAIPSSFLSQHRQCCQKFASWQIQTIEENKVLFNNMPAEKRSRIEATRACAAATYVTRYEVRHIGMQNYVVHHTNGVRWNSFVRQQRHHAKGNMRHEGSYEGRIHDLTLPWKQRLEKMRLYDLPDAEVKWLKTACDLREKEIQLWQIVEGARLMQIHSSQFCSVPLLTEYNRCITHSEVKMSMLPVVTTTLQEILCQMVDEQRMRDAKLHVFSHENSHPLLLTIIKTSLANDVVMVEPSATEGEDVALHLMLGDEITSSVGQEELMAKTSLLNNFCNLLQTVKSGDYALTIIYGTVTRFTACLFYLLYRIFEKVAFLPPSPGCVGQFVVCQRCHGIPKNLLEYLRQVQTQMNALKHTDTDVLQFIPMYDLFECPTVAQEVAMVEDRSSIPSTSTQTDRPPEFKAKEDPPMNIAALASGDVLEAEVWWTLKLVNSHWSCKSSEDISFVLGKMFKNHPLVQRFGCGERKSAYLSTYGIAPYFIDLLKSKVKAQTEYVLLFDESLNKKNEQKQMDFHVRFWENDQVITRYYTSQFMGHCTAADMVEHFHAATDDIPRKGLLQLSMDGPSVNWKFHEEVNAEIESDFGHSLLNVGSCGLHVVHGAFKTAVEKSEIGTDKLLTSLFYLFHFSPARREDFSNLTGSTLFPLKFCRTRWVENAAAAARAIAVWPDIEIYVKEVEKKKIPNPSNKSFKTVQAAVHDSLTLVRLAFFESVALQITPFLKRYQSDEPLMPFIVLDLKCVLRGIMERYVVDQILVDASVTKLTDIQSTASSHLKDLRQLDLGLKAERALKTAQKEGKCSEKDIISVKQQCRTLLMHIANKLIEKSPLQYTLARSMVCLDPRSLTVNLPSSKSRFKKLLLMLTEAKRVSETEADEAYRQFSVMAQECSTYMKTFDRETNRLDVFWFEAVAREKHLSTLWKVVRMLLLVSHGQAAVERGFSINREVEVENMKDETTVARRVICDHIASVGGLKHVVVDKKLLFSASCARQRYFSHLEKMKQQKQSQDLASGKRKLVDEIKSARKKKKLIEETIKSLYKDADSFAMKAEAKLSHALMSKSNGLRKKAWDKEKVLKKVSESLEEKLKEMKNL